MRRRHKSSQQRPSMVKRSRTCKPVVDTRSLSQIKTKCLAAATLIKASSGLERQTEIVSWNQRRSRTRSRERKLCRLRAVGTIRSFFWITRGKAIVASYGPAVRTTLARSATIRIKICLCPSESTLVSSRMVNKASRGHTTLPVSQPGMHRLL